jgi:signal transduction histidine kinase
VLFKLTPISIAIFVAAFVNTLVAYSSWRRRKAKSGMYFALAMMAITFWTYAAALDYAAVPLSLKVSFAKLEYLGYMCALALFTAFALSYAGYEDWLKKTWIKILLIGIPASNVLLAWTNEWHGWVWAGFIVNEAVDNVVNFEHGPAFIWVTLSSYGLILIIFLSLLSATLKGPELARKQARLLLFALLALVATNLIYLLDIFQVPGVDWSSIMFSITGLLFLFALYGSRFMDMVPIARNTMIERMADGVLVMDVRGNLVDFNPAAQAVFGIRPDDLWTPLQTALARWPEISALLENPARPEATEITTGNPARILDLRLTQLEDNRNRVYGLLIVMRDITERKQAESQREAALEALRELNATLEQRVAERTRELAEANLRLAELGRLKDEFITRISHELRNPLANIKLYLQLLEKGQPEKRSDYLQTLRQQTDRLQYLIEDLLDVSRLTLDEIEVRAASLDVTALLRELIADQAARAAERGLTLTALPAPDQLTLTTDRNLLRQALNNVLANAVSYTPRGGMITLRIDRATASEGEWVTIEVRDTGPGISAQDLPRLFEPFYRGAAAADYKIPGTGVGLSIARRLIERLGGRITVEASLGQGAAFIIWLHAD